MKIIDYEKLSESDHLKQEFLRQQFNKKITEYPITILNKINLDNIYFEDNSETGYQLRPIFRDDTDLQEWQILQDKFNEKALDILVNVLKQLSEIKIPARTDEKEIETNGVDYVDSEEEKAAAKEYFDRCHSQINHVRARKWVLKKGWDDKDIDRWNIGFDVEENAIIIPVDEMYYGKYTID